MEPKYETSSIYLTQLIDALGNNQSGTYLIPDFQRAYVWNPVQIINLLDTLFHGWPFGSILLAQAPRAGSFFTARPLYQRIKTALEWGDGKYKLDIKEDACVSQTGWLCLYRKVSGYWSRFKDTYSPSARIYLNISNLEYAMDRENDIQSLNYIFGEQDGVKPILEWCLDGETPNWNWRSGVPRNINEVKRDHILLSDIWDFTGRYIDKYASADDIVFRTFSEDNVRNLCLQKEVDYKPVLFEFFKHVLSLHKLSIPYTKISLPMPEENACESDINLYKRSVLNIYRKLTYGGNTLSENTTRDA